jgi:uncharacterized OsmC-like protein
MTMKTETFKGEFSKGKGKRGKAFINGVDVAKLEEKLRMISEDPGLGKARFRATNRWVNGGHNRATIGDFYAAKQENAHVQKFTFELDEPPLLLGEDRGANPVEYVLAALSGCLTTGLVFNAAAQGIEIDEIESEYEGTLDLRGFLGLSDQVRNGYDNIRVKIRVKADASQEKIDELVLLAQARSPVFDIVSNPVRVTVMGEKMGRESLH